MPPYRPGKINWNCVCTTNYWKLFSSPLLRGDSMNSGSQLVSSRLFGRSVICFSNSLILTWVSCSLRVFMPSMMVVSIWLSLVCKEQKPFTIATSAPTTILFQSLQMDDLQDHNHVYCQLKTNNAHVYIPNYIVIVVEHYNFYLIVHLTGSTNWHDDSIRQVAPTYCLLALDHSTLWQQTMGIIEVTPFVASQFDSISQVWFIQQSSQCCICRFGNVCCFEYNF